MRRRRSRGVNFADTHQRRNEYLAASELPLIPGAEVAGVRARHGRARRRAHRRARRLRGGGARCPRRHAFAVPDGVDDGTALALLLQGLTAWHLLRTSARVAAGRERRRPRGRRRDRLARRAARAAAGRRGARDRDRLDARRSARSRCELGADVAVDSDADGLTERLLEANGGAPVDVVLDAIGGEVFDASLAALAPFGRLVTYGVSGGDDEHRQHPASSCAPRAR